MRTSPSIAFFIWSLACFAASVSAAESPETPLVFHVPEGTAAGQLIADLPVLLELDEQATCRLLPPGDPGFEINAQRQLVVGTGTHLDYESDLRHRLTLEVRTPAAADAVQDRFVNLLGESSTASRFVKSARWNRRQVRVEIVVDDRPEPPQLLPQFFQTVATAGLELGRVVAVDPDRDDQLQFRLLDNEALLKIDPVSGRVSFREDATLPDVSRILTTVEVVDSQGLSDSRTITIALQSFPQPTAQPSPPVKQSEQPTVVDSRVRDSVQNRSPNDVESAPTVPVTVVELVPTSSNAEEPQQSGTNVPATSKSPRQTAEQKQLSDSERNTTALVPPASRSASRELPAAARQNRTAVWLLICFVCVLVFGVVFRDSLQRQFQKLVLQPQTAATEAAHEEFIGPQTSAAIDAQESAVPFPAETDATPRDSRGKTDTSELHKILESLDDSYGPHTERESTTGTATDDDEHFIIDDDRPEAPSPATIVAKAVKLARGCSTLSNPGLSNLTASSEALLGEKSERDQMEELRQIARTFSRADIHRSRRNQMRIEWMSRGAAVASALITGVICLFTNCFGSVSVPCGTVLLAVAAALLMKRSLYIDQVKPMSMMARHVDESPTIDSTES